MIFSILQTNRHAILDDITLGRLSLLVGVMCLTACQTVGTNYQRPDVTVPVHYKEQPAGVAHGNHSGETQGDDLWQPAQPLAINPAAIWWTAYHSPTLNQLMDRLNQQNLSIAQAFAQYRAAQASVQAATAGLSPNVGLSSGATRSGTGSGSSATSSTQASLGLSASWEIDVWGKTRRSIEASQDKAAASAATLAAMRLSMQTQLAINYLQLVNTDKQIRSLQQSIKDSQSLTQLTKNQMQAGTVAPDAYESANSQLRSSQAQLTSLTLTRSQYEHAIATLIGQPASVFSLPEQHANLAIPHIVANIPSTLLQRRPDIVEAERNMAAANAQIGVAQAAFYPNITLGGSGGFKSSSIGKLLSLPSLIWSVGPQLAMTLFDGGATNANVEIAKDNYEASVAAYRQTVLTAFQNVEDNLAAQRQLAEQTNYQNQAVISARRAETVALNQYKAGIIGYQNVINARKTRMEAETTLWNDQNQQLTNSVNLIAALGGAVEN